MIVYLNVEMMKIDDVCSRDTSPIKSTPFLFSLDVMLEGKMACMTG